MVKISPSIIAADNACFGQEAVAVEKAGADYLHIDVMDGHFVPNITIGSRILADIKKYTNLVMDVHLMVETPQYFLQDFAKAGADIITIHLESDAHIIRTLQTIRNIGKKSGISILPKTLPSSIEYLLDYVDLILIMLVDPGFSGQSTLKSQIGKINSIKNMIGNRPIEISADGGVNKNNARLLIDTGTDVLVAGNAIFNGGNYSDNITKLKNPI